MDSKSLEFLEATVIPYRRVEGGSSRNPMGMGPQRNLANPINNLESDNRLHSPWSRSNVSTPVSLMDINNEDLEFILSGTFNASLVRNPTSSVEFQPRPQTPLQDGCTGNTLLESEAVGFGRPQPQNCNREITQRRVSPEPRSLIFQNNNKPRLTRVSAHLSSPLIPATSRQQRSEYLAEDKIIREPC